ncbi:hypothetical protein [Amphibacillus indicireducens]|uniref:Uncharacterized protein n=1 Tax=Amphibacillus indicireducens TaxID=1076330 RepID=A0ABP7VBI9_9BACI
MKNDKFDWRIAHGSMIGFYILGIIAFSLIGDLSELINQIIFGVFVLVIIREIWPFIDRYRREKQK